MKITSIKNKKVLVRVDYNVPIKNGVIQDTTRIDKSIKTIKTLLDNDNSIILLSHMGKIETINDKKDNSLYPVYLYLKDIFYNIRFSYDTSGIEVNKKVKKLEKGQILLIENTRYEDLPNKRESTCSKSLSHYWASWADVFVFDAFASIHREHASTYGITSYIPSYMGYTVKEEIENLNEIKRNKHKILILGGAKVESKIILIEKLINKCDYVLIGGAMCFTFLKAKGYEIGKNFVDETKLEYAKRLLDKYENKIILPEDFNIKGRNTLLKNIKAKDYCYDIGTSSIKTFKSYIKDSIIVWNGPLGYAEKKEYRTSTLEICNHLNENNIKTFILGGDTVSIVKKIGLTNSYYSTGGGASLEYLSNNNFKILKRLK